MRIPLLPLILLAAGFIAQPGFAQAAQDSAPTMDRCAPVPDTAVAPTPQQVRERIAVRDELARLFQSHGQQPAGLLFLDIDSTHAGTVLFLDAPLADSTVQQGTAMVARYLEGLQKGRAYQGLIRVDGDYPVVAPGRRRCIPELDNVQDLADMMEQVRNAHPLHGRLPRGVEFKAAVNVVISREGKVLWAQVVQPTGDESIDPYLEEIASHLRYLPATLDGVPFDVRTTQRLTFAIY